MSQFHFHYRCSDDNPMIPLSTPVTVVAESREKADEKLFAIWGHRPKYASIMSIEEDTE